MNLVRLISILALASTVSYAAAQDYPTQPIRLVIPLTPGSGADIAGRIIGKPLGDAWNRPFVVENRAGAGGQIGTYQRIGKEANIQPQ